MYKRTELVLADRLDCHAVGKSGDTWKNFDPGDLWNERKLS